MTDYTELCERLRGDYGPMFGPDHRDAANAIEALMAERDALRMDLESYMVRHQDEVNARVRTEDDLYAMQQERRREHDLRVKFAGEIETLRADLREAVAILHMILPYSDLVVCYASTISEHPMNAIPVRVAAFLAKHKESGT